MIGKLHRDVIAPAALEQDRLAELPAKCLDLPDVHVHILVIASRKGHAGPVKDDRPEDRPAQREVEAY